MKKKKYQQGGPITPNYQTLGNIRFDSNISRPGPDGQMVVKDINTGKDFGIIRNDDGSYRYYSPRKKLQDNVEFHEINPLARTLLNEASPESVKYLDMAIPYLKQLSELSKNRVGGKMSAEEEQLRKSLADKITPVGYNPTGALEGVVTGTKSEYQFGRDEYLKEYLGLPSKMQESSYTIDNNKRYLKPYAPQFGDRGDTTNVYTNNALYERYRDLSIATEEKQGDKIQKGKSGSNIVINGGNYLNALGQYTMGRGVDDKGSYISVYDKWDLDPTRDMPKALKELSGLPDINNYNNPFEIYDRKYLSELSAEGRDSVYAKDKELGILPMDKRTKHSTGGQLNQMKKKKYASGGSMDPSMLLSILGPALGAVNPVLGASTQLMQQYINKQKQDAVVVSATPGNYDLGGPLYPMAQDSLQPMRYSIESTATNVGYNPLLVPIATGLTREEK